MFSKGKIVEVYEDPLTMKRKEGNARIVKHVQELAPGVNLYRVNFIGDDPKTIVFRKVLEIPLCLCCDPVHYGDNEDCPVHGRGK